MNDALSLRGLVKHYEGFALEIPELTLPTGCILGLIGENGAGKTTTIKALLGLLRPDQGDLEILGKPASDPDGRIREHLGVVLDDSGFPENLTPRDVGRILARIYSTWDPARYRRSLELFGLPERKALRTFSRGMKMKHAIAAALAHDCRLLILDEPTSGLDPVAREEFLDLLRDFATDEGHSVLISSHILSDLEKVCDTIAFLHRGRLVLWDEKDRLLERFCKVRGAEDDIRRLPAGALVGMQRGQFMTDALVRRGELPEGSALKPEPATLEEIMLYHLKEVPR